MTGHDILRKLHAVDDIIGTLQQVRGGTRIERALGLVKVARTLLERRYPEPSTEEQLHAMGYHAFVSPVHDFVRAQVMRIPAQVRKVGSRAVTFFDGFAAIPEASNTMYVRNEEGLFLWLRVELWKGGDLAMTRNSVDDVALSQMSPPGEYVGSPSVDYVVDRISRDDGCAGSILFVGPAGCGKSTLARLVASRAVGGRCLRIPAGMLRNPATTVAMVRLLKPAVVLIDDMQAIMGYSGSPSTEESEVLTLLEDLRATEAMVIGTFMQTGTLGRGALAGMRPGRFDETIFLKYPSASERRQILSTYLDIPWPTELIKKTDRMTGAYLRELARRVRVHGLDGWKAEVRSLRALEAPPVRRGPEVFARLTARMNRIEAKMEEAAGATSSVDEVLASLDATSS